MSGLLHPLGSMVYMVLAKRKRREGAFPLNTTQDRDKQVHSYTRSILGHILEFGEDSVSTSSFHISKAFAISPVSDASLDKAMKWRTVPYIMRQTLQETQPEN